MLFSKHLLKLAKVKRFRVQRSGLKNSQPAPIKGFCLHRFYGLGSNIGHRFFVGWVEHPDIYCWVSPPADQATCQPFLWYQRNPTKWPKIKPFPILKSFFTQWVMSGIPDLDHYS
jgi:hypothetical protein